MNLKKITVILLIILVLLSYAGCLKAPDTDGDGHRDPVDAFPEDPYDWEDSDGDGIGDNAEKDAGTNPLNSDTDGDGYIDSADLDPLDASIGIDSDGDGYHDAVDAFPDDKDEWADTDGDGYGDNSDRYPDDPLYHTSTLRIITDFSYEEDELARTSIYENESTGTEYTIHVTNNEDLGGNFTVTAYSCNGVDWTKQECEPGTEASNSEVVYVGANETRTVKVKVFSEYQKQVRTFKRWFEVIPPEVEKPA